MPSSNKQNNKWYSINRENPVVFVFVHGFFSNSETCWSSENGPFWPDLILADQRLGRPSIFLSGYYTDVDSGSYRLSDCADQIFSELSRSRENGDPAPILSENIIFVCHSLGGIVARYMIESKSHVFSKKTIGLVLMASPSLGSSYADLLRTISKFYKNKLGQLLTSMNEALVDLDDRFRELLDSNVIPGLVGVEAIEHKSILGWKYFPPLRPIVERWSSARYFGKGKVIPETNHSTIVKPNSIEHPSHSLLVTFIESKLKDTIKPQSQSFSKIKPETSLGCTVQKKPVDLILFEILDKESIPYYLTRSVDDDLSKNLDFYSIWVSGPSGSGKTSAIRHILETKGYHPIDICLSHCGNGASRQDYINEILSTANQLELFGKSDREMTYQSLVTLLSDYSNTSPIVLHLDEIPVSDNNINSMADLLDLISDVLTAAKQRARRNDLRLLISSIYEPDINLDCSKKKISAVLKIMPIPLWSRVDMTRLLEMILGHLPSLNLSEELKSELIDASEGSPRFMKTCIKNFLIGFPNSENISAAILQAKKDLVF